MLAYLRLFRWPNLLMVAFIQYLVRYAVILPSLAMHDIEPGLSHFMFFILVLATLFITAAGYAINDYFDLRTDRINKPQKIVLGKHISRRRAILMHSFLNLTGVALGIFLSISTGNWSLSVIFLIIPFLLWLYSIRYKRRFFIGNFIVAVMAAFVITIVWIFDYNSLLSITEPGDPGILNTTWYVRIYALFAFLTTLGREIIKDIEDIRGDAKTGCKTIPVISGVTFTKKAIVIIHAITIAFVAYIQIVLLMRDFDLLFVYALLFVQVPFIFLIHKTVTAVEKYDYSSLSRMSKYIMFSGVLTMIILYFYIREGFTVIPEVQ